MNYMGVVRTPTNWVERTTSKQGQMVFQGEGRGKIFSPPLVKYFGDQSLPKWGGIIQNGSLYSFPSIWVFLSGKIGAIDL
jgi:hypothetical protein